MRASRCSVALGCGLSAWLWTARVDGEQTAVVEGMDGTRSLALGVYSAAQAARGRTHYEAFCGRCHVSDLSGNLSADIGAPPLRGAPFVASMEKVGVASLFDYVKRTMPADDPSTLQDAEYLDILSYLIQSNGFPAGPGELTLADLRRVRVRP
jgi:cytochrome c